MLENTRKSLNRQAVTASLYLYIVIHVSIFLDIFCHDLVTFILQNLCDYGFIMRLFNSIVTKRVDRSLISTMSFPFYDTFVRPDSFTAYSLFLTEGESLVKNYIVF